MPKFIPTDDQREKVRMLRCCGVTHPMIASVLKIGVRTLEKHFREELSIGLADANAQIAGALYRKAIEGDTTAMIFWLKSRAGWRETIQNLTLSMDMKKSVDEYSDEELQQIIRMKNGGENPSVLVIDTSDRPDPRFHRNDAPMIVEADKGEPSLSELLRGQIGR